MVVFGHVGGGGLVGHLGADDFPFFLEHVAHWLNKLHPVVLGRVVRSGNHDANPLSLERSRPESRNEADTGQDGVEDICFCPEASCSIRIHKTLGRRVLLRGVSDGVGHGGG